MPPFVREATPADYPAIAALTAAVYVGEGFSPPTADAALRDIETRANATTLLVAVTTEALVGAVSLVPHGSPFRQVGRPGEVEVRLLAVDPVARGHGTGERLMREILTRARTENASVVLSTQTTMEAAQRLYARLGFTRQPARDWVQPSGRPMLVYTLP